MGHTQDTPHMKIADMEDTIAELQISCDGFAEQCSRLKGKIHNIEQGFKMAEKIMIEGPDIDICPMGVDGECYFGIVGREGHIFSAPTLADLIDAILIGGGTDES